MFSAKSSEDYIISFYFAEICRVVIFERRRFVIDKIMSTFIYLTCLSFVSESFTQVYGVNTYVWVGEMVLWLRPLAMSIIVCFVDNNRRYSYMNAIPHAILIFHMVSAFFTLSPHLVLFFYHCELSFLCIKPLRIGILLFFVNALISYYSKNMYCILQVLLLVVSTDIISRLHVQNTLNTLQGSNQNGNAMTI